MCFLAARDVPGVEAVVVTTTDKVYENDSSGVAFREQDRARRQGSLQRVKSLCGASYITRFAKAIWPTVDLPLLPCVPAM